MIKIFRKKGFTLIEVLISVFILTVGIVAILNIFPLGLQVRKGAEMSAVASWLSQEKIEQIVSTSYSDISSGTIESSSTPLAAPFTHYKRQTIVTCVDGTSLADVNCAVQPVPLKKVEIIVFWKPPFKLTEDQIKIVTFVVQR